MDTRTKRPVRTALSLGLGVALVATAGVVAATPIVTALATQRSAGTPAAARPAPAALHATVVRSALPSAVTPQGQLHGVSCAAGCTLTAMEGTVDVKAASGAKTLHVWKFADTSGVAQADLPTTGATSAGAASALLEGTVGVTMTITIHNALSIPVGLSIPQLDSEKDGQLELHDVTNVGGTAVVGAASDAANDKTYTFTPNRAGTFTYQAALTDNGSRGVAMGLVGALVVRPSSTVASAKVGAAGIDVAAYDRQEDPAAFQDEAVLVYTDVDSAMATDPIGFNMRSYRADYHLINGQAYPDVPSIGSAPGNLVMVRVVNGSILEKSPTILGTRFDEFATGSRPLPTRLSVSGRLVQTGDTFDALVTMPSSPATARYAIYDAPGALRNGDEINAPSANAPALGGGFVLIDSGYTGNGTVTGGGVTKLAAANQPGSASVSPAFSAHLASLDGGSLNDAELYVDSLTTPHKITISNCGQGCDIQWQLDAATLASITSGTHPIWVRAKTDGAWGPYALIRVRFDSTGPAVTQLTLSSPFTNATTDLDVTATLDERTTGGSMVTGARYWISPSVADTEPGSNALLQGELTVNGPRLIASGDVTIPALVPDPADPTPATPTLPLVPSDFAKLAEGSYQLYVQGWDELGPRGKGNLGTPVSTTLVIDKNGPSSTAVTIDPKATNGVTGSLTKPDSVRITATVTDALSSVSGVEGYLDAVPDFTKPAANANGIYFSKGAGNTWSADMPLSWLAAKKTDGPVTLVVVGTDAAGNRGSGAAVGSSTILIDRTPSQVAISSTALFRANGATRIRFTASASDQGSGVSYVEYFLGADPGRGNGVSVAGSLVPALPVVGSTTATNATTRPVRAFNVTFTSANAGYVPFTVRSRDLAGNWTQQTVNVPIRRDQLFGNGFDAPAALRAAAAATAWNVAPSGRTAIVAAGRIAGQRSLSVATGVVGYYTENVVKLNAASSDDLHVRFLMAPKGAATGCATAGGAARCAPNGVTVFSGTTSKGAAAVAVQYGRATATSRVQFRLGVLRSTGAIAWGAWSTVKTATTYDVRVDWASDAAGGGILRVNSSKALSRVAVSNATVHVTTVHVGVLNRVAKARGSILFDTFSIA